MANTQTICVISDIHFASAAERCRGSTELTAIDNPMLRLFVRAYRHFIWKRDPFAHNHLLDVFIQRSEHADCVVAVGDYSCDTAFVGVSDDASFQSAYECISKLRKQFGAKLWLTFGDHELGKMSLFGGRGGMRLASWERAQSGLGVEPFWRTNIGDRVLIGITSSLVALPIFEPDSLPTERAQWYELRRRHLSIIHNCFAELEPNQRMILFCHDPTALPFLWEDTLIQSKLDQLEMTIIGHLHSPLFLWKSRLLAGMPTIRFLGNSIRRMSAALHQARVWRIFKIELCPAPAGIELLKDGGYLELHINGGIALHRRALPQG